jgi:4-diphosphocytidyl-2-C-methyl-D-erythritol kinase
MGGFAGGDEGGYWESDKKPYSKNTLKLKNLHNISIVNSQYSIKSYAKRSTPLLLNTEKKIKYDFNLQIEIVDNIYDTISFVPCKCSSFTIEVVNCTNIKQNTIHRIYNQLVDFTDDDDIVDFFSNHKVVLDKKIEVNKGFGGASSNAAYFLILCKEVFNLILTNDELKQIGKGMDIDFVFFIYNFKMANLYGSVKTVELIEEVFSSSN